jgi:hypothetical protein
MEGHWKLLQVQKTKKPTQFGLIPNNRKAKNFWGTITVCAIVITSVTFLVTERGAVLEGRSLMF